MCVCVCACDEIKITHASPLEVSALKFTDSDEENFVPLNLAISLNFSVRGNFRTDGLNPGILKVNERSCDESI